MAAFIRQHKPQPFIIAFIGRVVPVKDVKTFIRAIRRVCNIVQDVEAYVMGDYNQDKEYYDECRELVRLLELQDKLFFLGNVDVSDWLSKIHLVVLTSISEGQPLAILEANAAGIPVVATDVGGCRELLKGKTYDDEKLGESGIITGLSDHGQTADAILTLLTNLSRYKSMAETGVKRTARYYDLDNCLSQYRSMYEKYLTEDQAKWQA